MLRFTRSQYCLTSASQRQVLLHSYKPFHKFDTKTMTYVPVKTFTESCQAHPSMYVHQGLVQQRFQSKRTTESGQEVTRTAAYETTLYSHPPEKGPAELDHNNVNEMYCISNTTLQKTFPEGLGGKVSQLFPPGHPRGFLYRKSSHLINLYIDRVAKEKYDVCTMLRGGNAGLVFDGPSGVGKSALMCQAVHFARSRNVLTLYIPNAALWTHGEWSWPSILLPGFFDVPDATRKFFLYFARANATLLKTLPLRVTPDLPVADKEPGVKTLYDLCDWVNRSEAPTSIERQSVAIKYFLDEIMQIRDRPVLYVVDGINLMSMNTHYRYPHPDFYRSLTSFEEAKSDIDMFVKEMPRIPSSRLAFVRGLNKIMTSIASSELKNHSVIGCTTRFMKDGRHSIAFPEATKDKEHRALDEYTPFYADKDTLLHPIDVKNFDEYEYRSFLRFLVNSGELAGFGWGPLWHHSSDFERKLYKIEFMSDRNPQRVIDHYHQEFLWTLEYQRIRQKQHHTENIAKKRAAEKY
eukprot:PhF_6_TR25659/c0_g1_i1/m.36127/K17408/DAP3, MRPS29; small subunit ribosomal protein S29